MRIQHKVKWLGTALLLGLLFGLLGCGQDSDAPQDAPPPVDESDPGTAEPSDETDATAPEDPTHEADASDPVEPEGSNCATYLDCLDACWESDIENIENCNHDCEQGATPEALLTANELFDCENVCHNESATQAAFEACYEENCVSLWEVCAAPPECIPACSNYETLCGDEGPLNRNRRVFQSGTTRVVLKLVPNQVVVALEPAAHSTPDLSQVEHIENISALSAKKMFVAHAKQSSGELSLKEASHPAIRATFPVFVNQLGQRLITSDEIILGVRPNPHATWEQELAALKIELLRPVRGVANTWLAKTTSGDALQATDRLLPSEHVLWAEPNFLRLLPLRHIPNDPYFSNQWHHHNSGQHPRGLAGVDLRTPAAWDTTLGSPLVRIAINDDGVDTRQNDIPFLRHEDGAIVGVHVPDNIEDALAEGCCTHGTSVAGVSCATADNALGTAGVCPNCSVIPVWTNYATPNEDVATAESFSLSVEQGAWIINNSWGPPDGNPALIEAPSPADPLPQAVAEAIESAVLEGRGGKGTVVIFAAGNGNEDCSTDAFVSHPLTLGVAAVNARGVKSSYSDFCAGVWVAAPSDGNHLMPGIVTSDVLFDLGYSPAEEETPLDPTGSVTSTFGGTSSAAPAVAGVVGLMLSANPDLSVHQVFDILRRTSRKIDMAHGVYEEDDDGFLKSPYYGYGLVDAHGALRAATIGCQIENSDLCIPASTCAEGPLTNVTEICNGMDDNCDGTVDEVACPEPAEPNGACDLSGNCADRCTWLDHDPVPACLDTCAEQIPCPSDFECLGGVCVPTSGRLSAPNDEVCDGFDNNHNGEIDEGSCELSQTATCEFSAQCGDTDGVQVCIEGFCASTCETTDNCEQGIECQQIASQYGNPMDTSVCAPSLSTGLSCVEACMFLHENAPGAIFQSIIQCVSNALSCDEAIACVPL